MPAMPHEVEADQLVPRISMVSVLALLCFCLVSWTGTLASFSARHTSLVCCSIPQKARAASTTPRSSPFYSERPCGGYCGEGSAAFGS
jgi:hypothetical protein